MLRHFLAERGYCPTARSRTRCSSRPSPRGSTSPTFLGKTRHTPSIAAAVGLRASPRARLSPLPGLPLPVQLHSSFHPPLRGPDESPSSSQCPGHAAGRAQWRAPVMRSTAVRVGLDAASPTIDETGPTPSHASHPGRHDGLEERPTCQPHHLHSGAPRLVLHHPRSHVACSS